MQAPVGKLRSVYESLIFRLVVLVGVVLFVVIATWAYYNIDYYRIEKSAGAVHEVDRLGSTILLGAHYAMMLNARDDINNIINNIARQKGIRNIRIYNKQGEIKFSNVPEEVERKTSIRDEACVICHRTEFPLGEVQLDGRTRFLRDEDGSRLLGVISPIYNEPNCSTDACHVHPRGKLVLGALDVVYSLEETDARMSAYERRIISLAAVAFLATSVIIAGFLFVFVNLPIKKLIRWTRRIARGDYVQATEGKWTGEIGQLSFAIDRMGTEIREKQEEVDRRRHEFQELFEQVPCYITVQDRELRFINTNREFRGQFDHEPGAHCYAVYKGLEKPCDPCPVLQTFEDGLSHPVAETGFTREGVAMHWVGRTSPVRDREGCIAAVMEMSLDITEMKRLEGEIRKSEEKYRSIFNNIPHPIFVLDEADLRILDCNESVTPVYGFSREELKGTDYLALFEESDREEAARRTHALDVVEQGRHRTREGNTIYVAIRVSPWEMTGRAALLVSTTDITKKLLAEQQLIQACKMATLGEMATGIAHELNQPLSVIKTASSFIMKKVDRDEALKQDILRTLAREIDGHVDRASGIINHLREFGRKSEVKKEKVDVNAALTNALDIFSQQLRVRGIELTRDLDEALPPILANSNRLEQVFINLLINARDAIEDKSERFGNNREGRQIAVRTRREGDGVAVEVSDSGGGIPKPVLDKIFEPFFTTKRAGKGTGLGLSISYGIVQDYEGTITVTTEKGQGSRFTIRFPAAEKE